MSHLAALIALGLFFAFSAQASDIACKTSLRAASVHCEDAMAGGQNCLKRANKRPHAENLICDYALLNIGYERIYASQLRMLRAGLIRKADITAWRKTRDACGSVKCLDELFAGWQQHAAQKKAARDTVQPKKPLAASAGDTPEDKAARGRPRRGEAKWSMTSTREPSAPPQRIYTQTSAQPPVLAPMSGAPSEAEPRWIKAPLAQERTAYRVGSLGGLAWLGILGVGSACLFTRRLGQRFPGVPDIYRRIRSMPVTTLILSGLLVVNALFMVLMLFEE
ncbi:hypothetical protein AB4Z48_16720 [Cupriavidus sp. 2TAF22]|uniref:hypothetical protein n=1 Tax=unclassified Cupriavidus TaxID=2640874 RepID=UPI003F91F542